ncbi:MAG: hypothetical protein WBM44_08420 [Waterburya sp.]
MNIKPFNLIFSATFLTAIAIANPIGMDSLMAQDEQAEEVNLSEEKGKDSPEAQNIVNLNLAYNLAEYGRENKDPQMLISAAKIIMETPVESLSLEKTTEEDPEAEVAEETKTDEERDVSASALLTEARELANNDSTIVALIDEVENGTIASRGKVGAPIRHADTVQAETTDIYIITFEGGRIARIGVDGDNDTDLDCYLYDEYGNPVSRDADYSDTCFMQWTPRWTGKYTLRIKNRGRVYNRYYLLTN